MPGFKETPAAVTPSPKRREAIHDHVHPLKTEEVHEGFDHVFGTKEQPGKAYTLFDEQPARLLSGLRKRKGSIGPEEMRAATAAEEAEGGVVAPAEGRFAAGEDPFEGTTINPDSAEAHTLEACEAMKEEMRQVVNEAGEALAKGDVDKASAVAKGLADRMEAAGKETLTPEIKSIYNDVRRNLDQAIAEKDPHAKSRLYRFACGALDFVPVAGPAKMLIEAAAGKTLGGEKMEGWKRFLHGAEGTVFLAIDLTGFGVVATKLAKAGKAGMMAPRLMTRTAAFMRVVGVPRKIYKPVFKFGSFLIRYPKLGQAATKGLEWMTKARKTRLATDIPNILKEQDPKAVQEIDEVSAVEERPGMDLKEGGTFEPVLQAA